MDLELEEKPENTENLDLQRTEESKISEPVAEEIKTLEPKIEESNTPSSDVKPQEDNSEENTGQTKKKLDQSVMKKFERLQKQLEEEESIDHKLQIVMVFMEDALSQSGTPMFKNFWEARKICIELFKENLSPGVRAHMWSKYGELTKQARALKEILDEQASFAVEQIEIAIAALEEEVTTLRTQTEEKSDLDVSKIPDILKGKVDQYGNIQRELNLLNAAASRINSLRKELIKTDMRIRQKNKFFQRLSGTGDKVFPRRKELIKEISQIFQGDIDAFIKMYFSADEVTESLFMLRDEIKKLQSFAKQLTLNTQSFTSTRLSLSKCWDKIKGKEKEWKKSRAQKKAVFKENAMPIVESITALDNEFKENKITLDQATNKIDDISNDIRRTELGRDEVKELKDSLNNVRKDIQAKRKEAMDARKAQEEEALRQKKQKFYDLKEELEKLIDQVKTVDINQLIADNDALKEKFQLLKHNKAERMELAPLFRNVGDLIIEKREESILNLPEGDRNAIENFKSLLQQRTERRREIKQQLEALRKSAGSSGMDFEQAMNINQQIEEEKTRLEKATEAIQEIEKKLKDIKSQ